MSKKHKREPEPNVDVRDFTQEDLYPTEQLQLVLRNYPKNEIIRKELERRKKANANGQVPHQ